MAMSDVVLSEESTERALNAAIARIREIASNRRLTAVPVFTREEVLAVLDLELGDRILAYYQDYVDGLVEGDRGKISNMAA